MDTELLGIGSFAVFGLLLFMVLLICFEQVLEDHARSLSANPSEDSFIDKLSRSLTAERSAMIMPRILREFSFSQLESATSKFSKSSLIRSGHSGDIYSGWLEGGELVAIKRLQPSRTERDFYLAEIDVYGKVLDQRYLVTLLGQCLEDDEKLLVYEYLPNGDLATALAEARANSVGSGIEVTPANPQIPWATRLKIARGVAEALAYLHHVSRPRWAHRNIQGSSILLTDNYEVKLGSLSEAQKLDSGEFAIYDIYCFGTLLLDLISGLNISGCKDEEAQAWTRRFVNAVLSAQSQIEWFIMEVLDPNLEQLQEDQLREVIEVAALAKSCIDPTSLHLLSMKRVFETLKNL